MQNIDIKKFKKEIETEYLNKGYSEESLEYALINDSRYPKDRLIEVTGYDLENGKILGLFNNKPCEVTINQASFNEIEAIISQRIAEGKMTTPTSWVAHKIDKKMEEAIPAKSQLIIQSSILDDSSSTVSFVASRISKVNSNGNVFATDSTTPKSKQ